MIVKKIILFFFLFNSFYLYANHPTTWDIVNLKDKTVELTCIGQAQGLKNNIKIKKILIRHQSVKEYKWDDFDNDGLGLNGADWKCKIDKKRIQFHTQWGENISIIIGKKHTKIIKDV